MLPIFAEFIVRAHPELNQGPADLQSAALTTELYTPVIFKYVTIVA